MFLYARMWEPFAYTYSHTLTQIQGVFERGAEGRFGFRKIEVTGGSRNYIRSSFITCKYCNKKK
jgi:hypothetical protein